MKLSRARRSTVIATNHKSHHHKLISKRKDMSRIELEHVIASEQLHLLNAIQMKSAFIKTLVSSHFLQLELCNFGVRFRNSI